MKQVRTFSEYMNDDARVSSAEREKIAFEIELIGKMIEAREEKGLSQRDLAEMSGVKQPEIESLERMKTTQQIDTIFNILNRLEKMDGVLNMLIPKWTLELQVPLGGKQGLFQWEMLIMQCFLLRIPMQELLQMCMICYRNMIIT